MECGIIVFLFQIHCHEILSLQDFRFRFPLLLYLLQRKERSHNAKGHKNPKNQIGRSQNQKSLRTIVIHDFYHNDLSNEFDIKVVNSRYRRLKPFDDSCATQFTILDKHTQKVIDTFSVAAGFCYEVFDDKNKVRSYSTKVNYKKQVLDGNYGDIVVADLNFDHKDDIAIAHDMGASTGTFYQFYVQQDDRKFILDRFLTDSVTYFPDEIKNKTLTTYGVGGACYVHKHVYAYDTKQKTFKEKSHIVRDVCNNKFVPLSK